MEESFPNRYKTLREKAKLLITRNFSFSYSVFERLALQTRKNQGLFGKRLKNALRNERIELLLSVMFSLSLVYNYCFNPFPNTPF